MNSIEKDFTWACCELSGYKKGYISIHLDFTSNVLSWKDSNHWYNNFVRGLPKQQIDPVRRSLIEFIREQKRPEEDLPSMPQEYVWTIQIGQADHREELKGYDITTKEWLALTEAIEKVARREFRL